MFLFVTILNICQSSQSPIILNYFIWKCRFFLLFLLLLSKRDLINTDSLLLNYNQCLSSLYILFG